MIASKDESALIFQQHCKTSDDIRHLINLLRIVGCNLFDKGQHVHHYITRLDPQFNVWTVVDWIRQLNHQFKFQKLTVGNIYDELKPLEGTNLILNDHPHVTIHIDNIYHVQDNPNKEIIGRKFEDTSILYHTSCVMSDGTTVTIPEDGKDLLSVTIDGQKITRFKKTQQ